MRKAAVYARISLDRKDGEGVARQLADCRELAAAKGWEVAGEYVDNDLSAFRAKRRPEWDRLLGDLAAGVVDALIAYHPDRTYRRGTDLEQLIDIVEQTGAEVATVKAGDVDLATATGRMGARIVAAVSRHESERIGERVSRAKRQRAEQGKPPGGGIRAFGYKVDKVTIDPVEADLLRDAAARGAAGESLYRIAGDWNDAGVVTPRGGAWTTKSLSRVLTSPRVAGLRSYKGEIVGTAVWPAIVDRDTWDRLRAMHEGRLRGPSKAAWLISGMIECPRCGRVLYGSRSNQGRRSYHCSPQGGTRGCGKASIAADPSEAKVRAVVESILDDAASYVAQALAEQPESSVADELDAIEDRRTALAKRWASGRLTDDEYDAAREVLAARAADLKAPPLPAMVKVPDLRGAWERDDVDGRRAVIAALIRIPMTLEPGRMANPADRLTVLPIWS